MNAPIDRLRDADPAASLGPQPDERAEADLRLLLAEPRTAVRPAAVPERRRGPVLATAVVALAVVALVAAVLGAVHPRTDAGADPSIAPTLGTGCHPAQILPFECGTYRSEYGDARVAGDAGGPAKDRLSISITREGGGLVLRAVGRCIATRFPVTLKTPTGAQIRSGAVQIEPAEAVRFTANGCAAGVDTKHWAHTWLQRSHGVDASGGLTFDLASAMVTFEFQGSAPIGRPQLPRTDRLCDSAHVTPFSCSTSVAIRGTGSLAFMAANPFRMDLQHVGGELVAGFSGRCNAINRVFEPDGDTVVALGGSVSTMACGGGRDSAVLDFFSGVLIYRVEGPLVTFTSGSSSVTFTSEVGACGSAGSASPFCGTSVVRTASKPLGALQDHRLTFGRAGGTPTATLPGVCDTTVYAVALDRSTIRFLVRRHEDTHPCPDGAADHDVATEAFLTGALTYSVSDGVLTLTSVGSDPDAFIELAPQR